MTSTLTRTSTDDVAWSDRLAGVAPSLPYLFVVLDCENPSSGGARYALVDLDEVVIGRGPARRALRSDAGDSRRLTLEIPGREVSATHARLVASERGWELRDAGSKNGTFAEEKRIERHVLADGDLFSIGRTLFRFRAALVSPNGAKDLDFVDLQRTPVGMRTLLPEFEDMGSSLGRAAKAGLSILLLGETGTGKELTAKAVHDLTGRTGAFIGINCGALPAHLLESALFGHVKGAFSGAVRDEPGAFRSAHGGTLLLDEIGDLPKAAQPALLRVLQERQVMPVGSARPIDVDVCIVAATLRPLTELCGSGEFREDLLARLQGYVEILPSLRERKEDLGLLAADIMTSAGHVDAALSLGAGVELARYAFPANIRELAQALRRALALADDPRRLTVRDLFPSGRDAREGAVGAAPAQGSAQDEFRAQLVAHFERHQGNVADVARTLGRSRVQVYRWLEKYQIDPNAFRS